MTSPSFLRSESPTNAGPLVAEVMRGRISESRHYAYYAEADAAGALISYAGDPDLITTLRSAAKPLQALPLVLLPNAAELNLADEELAICCASHPGLPRHTALAASVLALSGYLPDDLICGPAGNPPVTLKHGCSGNHAALLAAAHLMRAPLHGYERPDHPVQKTVCRLIGELAGAVEVHSATDGCGIPTFGLRLREMALAFARLTRRGAPWERIPRVMGAFPELIGDDAWIDVRLMRVTSGRIIAKTGAEGLLCLGLAGSDRGMAVKVLDGSTRALGPVTIAALRKAGWLSEEEAGHPDLADLRRPRWALADGAEIAQIDVSDELS